MAIQGLGERLRHARKDRKLSQVSLAKAAGIKQPSLSELESGESKSISGDTLVSIAAALRVRPEWIVTGKGPRDVAPQQALTEDEIDLLAKYRTATPRWRLSIRYMAALQASPTGNQ